MSRTSPNPRRYSRGKDSLDHNEPLHVFIQLVVVPAELETTVRRIEHLLAEYPAAVVSVASYQREKGRIILILDINMGPARGALLGTSSEVQAGYGFIWAVVKTLYYTSPRFCPPPPIAERFTNTISTQELVHLIAN